MDDAVAEETGMTASDRPRTTDVDAVVIGAGFSGLYMLHKLRNKMGLTARVFETGGGVGGTWYWNRYPGARSDSDSYVYGFTFDEELWRSGSGVSATRSSTRSAPTWST